MKPVTVPLFDPHATQNRNETSPNDRYSFLIPAGHANCLYSLEAVRLRATVTLNTIVRRKLSAARSSSCTRRGQITSHELGRNGYPSAISALLAGTEAALPPVLRSTPTTRRYPSSRERTKAYCAGLVMSAFTNHQ